MGIEIPEWLQWVAKWVVGAGDWPEGDETAMRRVADAWSGMSAALNELDDDAAHTMQQALAAIDGQTHDAIAAHWDTLAGKEGAWQALVGYIDKLADQIGDGAADIEHTKLVIIGAMVIFSIEVAPLLLTAWTGFSAGGAVVLRIATQVTIRMAIKQLIARLLTRAAAKAAARVALLGAINEALEEGGLELGVKVFQAATGRRDEITLQDVKAAGIAAAAGAAGGAVGGGLGRSGLLSGVDDVAASRLGRATVAATTETATGIAGETAAAATVAALTDQPFNLTLESITSSAAQGVPHGLHSAANDTDTTSSPPDLSDSGPDLPAPSDNQPPERTQPAPGDTGDRTQPSSSQPQPEATQPASTPADADGTDSDSVTSNPPENTTPASTSSAQPQNTTAHTSEVGNENSGPTPAGSTDSTSNNPQPQTPAATPVSAEGTSTPSHADSPSDSSTSTVIPDPGPPTLSGTQTTSIDDTAHSNSDEQDPTGTTTSPAPAASAHISSEIGGQPTAPSNPAPAAYDAADQSGSQPSIQNRSTADDSPPLPDRAAPAPGQRVDASTAPDTATPSTTGPLAATPPATPTSRSDAQADSPSDTVTSSAVATASPAAVPPNTLAGPFAPAIDPGQRSTVSTPDPAASVGPAQSATAATPRPDHPARPRTPPQPVSPPTTTSEPGSTGAPPADLAHRASPADRASSGGTARTAPFSDRTAATDMPRRDDTSEAAQPNRRADPSTRRHSNTNDPGATDSEAMSYSGGAVRPRDDFAAFEWAEDAYDHFRRDDGDIDDIARTLGEHPRTDGSHFTRDDVEQIKNHLFREEHPIIDYDGNLIRRRFDADPAIAEAWIRLRAGHPLPADIVLLEHELAESTYLRADPGSTYQDAHAHANLDHHWSNDIPPRTGERYDTLWGRHDGTADLLQPDQGQPERSGVPVRGDEGQPRSHTDHRQDEQHRPHGPTGGRDLPGGGRTDHDPGQTREAVASQRRDRLVTEDNRPRPAHSQADTPRPQESDRGPQGTTDRVAAVPPRDVPDSSGTAPHRPSSPRGPVELSYNDLRVIEDHATRHGLVAADIVRGVQDGTLRVGQYGVYKNPEQPPLHETPDKLDPEYLTEVVDHDLRDPVRRRYASVEPDAFEPGCADNLLPDHLTRSMPGQALDDATAPIDPTRLVVNYPGDGLSPVWRDRSAEDAFLDARNALFRMDSRGPEIFDLGFSPRDPDNLNIGAHVGHTGPGQADGFVSLSRSPEHTIARETDIAGNDLDRLADEGQLTRLPDGTFRQTMYMHELYHPHGIDVDATFHDATAHSRYNAGSHREAEVLAPGGISGDTVYRVWPREIIVDANGNLVSVRVGEPVYNPRFAHLDNPRFAHTHDIPAVDRGRQAGEHAQQQDAHSGQHSPLTEHAPPHTQVPRPEPPPHRSGFDPNVHRYVAHFNDGRVIPHDPFYYGRYNPHIGRYQPTPQETEAAYAHPLGQSPYDIQVRNWLDGHQQHTDYRAPESQPPTQQDPWRSMRAPESLPPTTHEPRQRAQENPRSHGETQRLSTQRTQNPYTERPHPDAPHVRESDRGRVPPRAPEARAPVADLSSMRAPESLPPQPRVPSPPRHVAEPHSPVAPHRSGPSTSAPHNPRRPANREPRQHLDTRIERHMGSGPQRQDPHVTVPLHDPHSSAPPTEVPDRRRPIDPETQRALEARNARENYRRRAPDRVIAVRPDRTPGIPAYEMRRYAEGPEHVAVVSVRIHLSAGPQISPQEMRNLIENAHLATDRAFNYGHRLLSGDWLLVDVVFTDDPSTAHLSVDVNRETADPRSWHPHDSSETLTNHLREHLGLPADSRNQPTVRPEDLRQISNDIAAANTPTRFTGLPETRVIDHNRLTNLENRSYQQIVEDSLRDGDRFTVGADPRTHPYGRLINDGGPGFPGRGNNCLDSALAALSSFFGRPQVSLPRYPDRLADGTIDQTSGERNGPQRAADWLGSSLRNHAGTPVPDQFMALHNQISAHGPGSAALVINEWHARDPRTNALLYHQDGAPVIDGSHATVIVYPLGASGPVWWDPQQSTFSDRPPADMIHNSAGLWSIPIPPNQGVNSAGISNQRASGAVSGTDLQPRPGVSDLPVRALLGLSADLDSRADRERSEAGLGELRGERRDGSGDSSREPRADHDRGEVRRGDPHGPTGTGLPGVSADLAGVYRADTGRREGDRVPAPSDVTDRSTGTEQRTPARDRQEHPVVQSDGQHVGERGFLGRDAQPDGWDLAATGDVRLLDGAAEHDGPAASVPTSTQATSPNTNTQVLPIPARPSAPADPGRSRDRSDEPADRRHPPNPAPGPSAEDARRYDPAFIENLRISNSTPADRPDTRPVERSADPNAATIFAENQRITNPTPDNRPETPHVERSAEPPPRDLGMRGAQGQIPIERLVDSVRDRVAQDPKFELSYSERDLNNLIEHGRRLGIDDRGIADLIHIGSRLAKPITADVLAQHMENWADVVSDRGYPYRFEDAGHFNAFARDLDRILHDAGFGDHGIFVQGSALRSPQANDIDIAVVIDRDRFHAILVERYDGRIATKATDAAPGGPLTLRGLTRAELQALAQRIHENPKAYNNQALTFANAVRKGVIRSTHDISKSLKAAGKEIQNKYPELNIEDISLIVPGSDFDSSPELPVVETTDKDRAHELTRRLEAARELEFQRDLADGQRGKLLAQLNPHIREIVQLSRDLAETNRVQSAAESLGYIQAREALDRIREALERGAPLTDVSKDVALAKERMAAAQQLELHSRLDALRELQLGEHRQVVAQIIELDVRERNLSTTTQLEITERALVEVATREVLEFRNQQPDVRTPSLQLELNTAREYEQALARGQAQDLGEVTRNFDAIQRAIRHEQAIEARRIEELGLDPAHRQIVTQALDTDRARTLGKAAETLGKEIVRQHHNEIVGPSRVLQLTPDQARRLDIQTYSLCLDLTPTNFDHERSVYVYEPPGRPPVHVPYDSPERRYAQAVKAIRDGLSPQVVEVDYLRSIGHATAAEEAVRRNPEVSPRVTRARALELERARQLRIERDR